MRALAISVALALALAPLAHAQGEPSPDVIGYRVKQGDSLSLLAAEFYGDRNKANLIMLANRLERPRPLKPGERLKIPVSRVYTTAPGDTFETIAATFLGNPRRGTFLAELNGLPADDRVPSGTELALPLTITHRAQATESIAAIATAYFGSDKNAQLLRQYNFLGDRDTLDKGEAIVVPLFNVRLQAAKLPPPDAESIKRRERQKKAQAKAAQALPAARLAWRDGDYGLVKDTLAGVEPDVDFLPTPQAIEVGVLVGAAHIASDATKPALEAFKRVLERKPNHLLSPYYFSPKVIAVWKDAGGGVAGEPP